jgi:hypothetical protein
MHSTMAIKFFQSVTSQLRRKVKLDEDNDENQDSFEAEHKNDSALTLFPKHPTPHITKAVNYLDLHSKLNHKAIESVPFCAGLSGPVIRCKHT